MGDNGLDNWINELRSGQPFLDEKSLTAIIKIRVEQLLVDNPDLLFSYLYRLDVDEYKIQHALGQGDHIALSLAKLIVDRQKIRISTKSKYRSRDLTDEEPSFDPIDF